MSSPAESPAPTLLSSLEARVRALETSLKKDAAWATAHAFLTLAAVAGLAYLAGAVFGL